MGRQHMFTKTERKRIAAQVRRARKQPKRDGAMQALADLWGCSKDTLRRIGERD